MDLGSALDGIVSAGAVYAKDQIVTLVDNAKSDADAFVQSLGDDLEENIQDLANNKISLADFKSNVQDLADLSDMEKDKISIEAKAKAEEVATGITNLVVNGLFNVLKV